MKSWKKSIKSNKNNGDQIWKTKPIEDEIVKQKIIPNKINSNLKNKNQICKIKKWTGVKLWNSCNFIALKINNSNQKNENQIWKIKNKKGWN